MNSRGDRAPSSAPSEEKRDDFVHANSEFVLANHLVRGPSAFERTAHDQSVTVQTGLVLRRDGRLRDAAVAGIVAVPILVLLSPTATEWLGGSGLWIARLLAPFHVRALRNSLDSSSTYFWCALGYLLFLVCLLCSRWGVKSADKLAFVPPMIGGGAFGVWCRLSGRTQPSSWHDPASLCLIGGLFVGWLASQVSRLRDRRELRRWRERQRQDMIDRHASAKATPLSDEARLRLQRYQARKGEMDAMRRSRRAHSRDRSTADPYAIQAGHEPAGGSQDPGP